MKKAGLSSILIAVALLAVAVIAEAQPAKKIPRVGFLIPGTPSSWSARIEAFQQGLRELGYVEGQNISIEFRYAEGKFDRVPDLAAEMVWLKVDVIVTCKASDESGGNRICDISHDNRDRVGGFLDCLNGWVSPDQVAILLG